jgi:hypothetical protein
MFSEVDVEIAEHDLPLLREGVSRSGGDWSDTDQVT